MDNNCYQVDYYMGEFLLSSLNIHTEVNTNTQSDKQSANTPINYLIGDFYDLFLTKIWNDTDKIFTKSSFSFAIVDTAREVAFQCINGNLQIVFNVDRVALCTINISPSVFEKMFSLHAFHALFKTLTEKQLNDTDNQDFLRSLSCLLIGFVFKYSEIKYGSGVVALMNFNAVPLMLGKFTGSNRTLDFL